MDVTVVPASAGEEGVPPDEPLLVSPPITPLLAQKPTTYLGFNRDTLEIRSRCESPSHLARRDSRAAAPRVPRVASGAASSAGAGVSAGDRHAAPRVPGVDGPGADPAPGVPRPAAGSAPGVLGPAAGAAPGVRGAAAGAAPRVPAHQTPFPENPTYRTVDAAS